ncbi:MAG: DUF91 domain-containing protein [Candidatus Bathyarchaeota archaeon]|nr:MAG: DUF91 domain-containing protein [Candidatus Bathyarchaeota archaeon]
MAIRRISVKDENELQKVVSNDVNCIEDGLTAICNNMPIDSKSNIDVLCHDEDGQLVIVKLSTKENDNMFFEGLKILTYINNVKPMLKFSYKDFKINDSKMPRLVFLAPSFSAQLVEVVGQMQGIQMDLYNWEYFEFDGKKALHLESAWLSEPTKSKPRRKKPEKPKPQKKVETEPSKKPEEITEEVMLPPREVQLEPEKESKDHGKKKSIFSI